MSGSVTLIVWWLTIVTIVTTVCEVTGNSNASNDYVTYQEGDFPLIISAPHGGNLTPSSIPDRHDGCKINGKCVYDHQCSPRTSKCRATTVMDMSTKDIALALSQYIHQVTGRRPYLVINELNRVKLDANRALEQATFLNPEAVEAYGNYTLSIYKARTLIGLNPGERGLFVDIHGQTHSEEWTELGYRITRENLNSGDIPLDTSSIRALIDRTCGEDVTCAKSLISGNMSLGNILEAKGYKVVPSPGIPSPGEGGYYRGGYNTETYGSKCDDIDAIQIEIARHIRFGDWQSFANDLGDGILDFMNLNGYVKTEHSRDVDVTGDAETPTQIQTFVVAMCILVTQLFGTS